MRSKESGGIGGEKEGVIGASTVKLEAGRRRVALVQGNTLGSILPRIFPPGSISSSAAQPMMPMRNTLGSIRPRKRC